MGGRWARRQPAEGAEYRVLSTPSPRLTTHSPCLVRPLSAKTELTHNPNRLPHDHSEGLMRFSLLCSAVAVLSLLAGFSQSEPPKDPNIASTRPLTPEEEVKSFHLPPGFAVELVAA